jgi:hypothetical protein
VLRQPRAPPVQPPSGQTTAQHRNPDGPHWPTVVRNGHPGYKRGDHDPYARARQQTGRTDRNDAVIKPAGSPNDDFFDQPENQENQQRSPSVAHR